MKERPFREMTASDIKKKAIEVLIKRGARVRSVHNVSAYRGFQNHVEKGWPDIQGYSATGVVVLCEVKKIGDTYKKEQIERLTDCRQCGGVALTATQCKETGQFILEDFLKD